MRKAKPPTRDPAMVEFAKVLRRHVEAMQRIVDERERNPETADPGAQSRSLGRGGGAAPRRPRCVPRGRGALSACRVSAKPCAFRRQQRSPMPRQPSRDLTLPLAQPITLAAGPAGPPPVVERAA